MALSTTGMEFASEMVMKAALQKMRVTEVPIVLHKDGRSRPPHLRSWRDGWRHLRFMLLHCPLVAVFCARRIAAAQWAVLRFSFGSRPVRLSWAFSVSNQTPS